MDMEIYYQRMRSDEVFNVIRNLSEKFAMMNQNDIQMADVNNNNDHNDGNNNNDNRFKGSTTLYYGRSQSLDTDKIINNLYGSSDNPNHSNNADNNNNPLDNLNINDNLRIPDAKVDAGDDVIIGEINTPCNFYLIKNNPDIIVSFMEFEESLNHFYNNDKNRINLIELYSTSIENNRYGVAKIPSTLEQSEKRWARIQVVNHSDQSTSQCFFIDYGMVTPILTNEIYKLDDRFKQYPARSFKAALADVSPKSEFWSLSETSFFESLSKDKELIIIPMNIIDNDDRHECNLLDNDIDINDEVNNFIRGSCS
ncbi:uncharacterized protein LOC113796811 [Dermatophagoides pteronyssinus]|uniref:Tudor domain-containing protein 7 n=1 Tax=Dermatophagoides pteronyssinus TaxID=6956 RepID=A0ABQ8JLB1_DERPT|nr:Tudor domain-containing protein 7 [Dermatophagoides pteronyssinus]